MKLITAIVRTSKIDEITDALDRIQVSGMTVTDVRGHGRQKGHTAIYREHEYEVSLLPKIQFEVVVADEMLDSAVRAIIGAARTGEIGDGRIFVTPVEQAYRVRTGEQEVSEWMATT
jgi:nitrogen regulatory protein P-II 1